jgi:hypothetical protein
MVASPRLSKLCTPSDIPVAVHMLTDLEQRPSRNWYSGRHSLKISHVKIKPGTRTVRYRACRFLPFVLAAVSRKVPDQLSRHDPEQHRQKIREENDR